MRGEWEYKKAKEKMEWGNGKRLEVRKMYQCSNYLIQYFLKLLQ